MGKTSEHVHWHLTLFGVLLPCHVQSSLGFIPHWLLTCSALSLCHLTKWLATWWGAWARAPGVSLTPPFAEPPPPTESLSHSHQVCFTQVPKPILLFPSPCCHLSPNSQHPLSSPRQHGDPVFQSCDQWDRLKKKVVTFQCLKLSGWFLRYTQTNTFIRDLRLPSPPTWSSLLPNTFPQFRIVQPL